MKQPVQNILALLLFYFINLSFILSQERISIPPEIQSLHDSIKKYQQIDSSIAFNYIRQVEALAKRHNDPRLTAWSRYYHANVFAFHSDFDRSAQYFEWVLEDAKQLHPTDHKLLSMTYANYGALLYELGDMQRNQDFNWLTYKHTIPLKDTVELATSYYNIASSLLNLGNYKEASRYAQQALNMDLALKDSLAISQDLGFLANIHFKKKEYDKAAEMYLNCLSFIDTTKHKSNYVILLSALADVYNSNEVYDSAFTTANQAYQLVKDGNDVALILRALIHRSYAQFYLGQREIALNQLEFVSKTAMEKGLYREQIRAHIALGKVSLFPEDRLDYLLKAFQLAKDRNLEEYQSVIYPQIRNNKDAFERNEDWFELQESYIDFLEKRQESNLAASEASLQAMYDLMRIEEENEVLQLRNTNQQISLTNQRYKIYGLIGGFLFLISLLLFWMYRQQNERKIDALQQREQIHQLRTRVFQLMERSDSEINLPDHDTFNKLIPTPLTEKEYEILKDLLARKSNQEMANEHFISINTVKFHLKNIYSKLDVSDRKKVFEKIINLQ